MSLEQLKDFLEKVKGDSSIQEKLQAYEKFIAEEDVFLSSMINNHRELKLVQNATETTKQMLKKKPEWYSYHKLEGEEEIEDEEINSYYSKQAEDNKRYNGKSASEGKNHPDKSKYGDRKSGQ